MLSLVVLLISVMCGVFFYFHALIAGLGRKRWALAGIMFGPLVWPMFAMKKRMLTNRLTAIDSILFRA